MPEPEAVIPPTPAAPLEKVPPAKDGAELSAAAYLGNTKAMIEAMRSNPEAVRAAPEVAKAVAKADATSDEAYAKLEAEQAATDARFAELQAQVVGTPPPVEPVAVVPPVAVTPEPPPAPVVEPPVTGRQNFKFAAADENEAVLLEHAQFLVREARRNGQHLSVPQSILLAQQNLGALNPAPAPVEPEPTGPTSAELMAQAKEAKTASYAAAEMSDLLTWAEKSKEADALQEQAQAAFAAEQSREQTRANAAQSAAQAAHAQESQQAYEIFPELANKGDFRDAFEAKAQQLRANGDERGYHPVAIGELVAADFWRAGKSSAAVTTAPPPPAIAPPTAPPVAVVPVAATPPRPQPVLIGRGNTAAPVAPDAWAEVIRANSKAYNAADVAATTKAMLAKLGRR